MRRSIYTCKVCGKDSAPWSKLGYCAKCQAELDIEEEKRKKQEEDRILKRKGGKP